MRGRVMRREAPRSIRSSSEVAGTPPVWHKFWKRSRKRQMPGIRTPPLESTGMAVAVIGVGAIGGLIAAELLAGGHEVRLCTRTPIERLTVERDEHPRDLPVPPAGDAPIDFAVVALKGQDSAQAQPWLERLAPETVVVVQNGVEHEAHIAHP